MTTPQPTESWQRIESLLLDARSHLSQEAEVLCDVEIGEFEEFIGHNELELAFDALVMAFEKSTCESWRGRIAASRTKSRLASFVTLFRLSRIDSSQIAFCIPVAVPVCTFKSERKP